MSAAVELQRQARGRAIEFGHKMGEWEQVTGNHLECACTECGFHAGINLRSYLSYGLALANDCPGPKGEEAA